MGCWLQHALYGSTVVTDLGFECQWFTARYARVYDLYGGSVWRYAGVY